jgi:hypothetical protein
MKRNIKSLMQTPYSAIVCLFLVLIGCTEENAPIAVTGVTLSPTSITLVEGESKTLTVTISPSDATNQKVSWASSNPSVATVTDGVVSALKVGNATITVTTEDGGKTATCEVLVNAELNGNLSFVLNVDDVQATSAKIQVEHDGDPATDTWCGFLTTDTTSPIVNLISDYVSAMEDFSELKQEAQETITLDDLAEGTNYRYVVFGLTGEGETYGQANSVSFTTQSKVSTEEDQGDLNYGEEGAAGDNIEEGKDIYDGGSH